VSAHDRKSLATSLLVALAAGLAGAAVARREPAPAPCACPAAARPAHELPEVEVVGERLP
jgi:hypothetical protein